MTRDLLVYDPDLGVRFAPNQRRRIAHESGGYLLQTNSLGFRDLEPEDIGGLRQIQVFGDSFTAGDGVSNGKRWSDRLGELLPGVRVQNFGLPGSGTDQQYLAWRKFGQALPCDLLVVGVLVENIRRITSTHRMVEDADGAQFFRAKPYFTLEGDALVRHHDPVPRDLVPRDELKQGGDLGGRYPALRKLVSRLGLKDLVQQMTSYQPVADYDSPESPGWRLLRAILERWSGERAGAMAIVPIPLYQHIEGTADASAYQARFDELGAAIGRPIVDPLPALRDYDAAGCRAFRFRKDVHLTPAGHAALARAVAPGIGRALGVSACLTS